MAVKFIAKVKAEDDKWYFISVNKITRTTDLIETVIGLYNKGYILFEHAQEAIQLARDCGYKDVKLVTFDTPPQGKPFLESEIA